MSGSRASTLDNSKYVSNHKVALPSFLCLGEMIQESVQTLQSHYAQGGLPSALQYLASMSEKDLLLQLVERRCLEDNGQLEEAENAYLELLETFSGLGTPCPLGLFHYLSFIHRCRGVSDALSFFDDMYVAESEHITAELYPAVATSIAWNSDASRDERLERASEIFRKGLARSKGTKRTELLTKFAEFLAFSANELKQAQLELSSAAIAAVWRQWESILIEFNADVATINNMNRIFRTATESKKNQLVEDVSGIVTISDLPDAAVESWLLSSELTGEKVIKSIMDKFRLDAMFPATSVLEAVLGQPERCGLITDEAEEDLRDGGMDTTNHVFRPDVTKMLKYSPHDEMERKVEIPKTLRNLIALLPARALRHANTQYVAEQCVRLLVSITMPPRAITEDAYANADKRARAIYEQKYVKQMPVVAAPVLKDKAEEDTSAQRVKEEKNF